MVSIAPRRNIELVHHKVYQVRSDRRDPIFPTRNEARAFAICFETVFVIVDFSRITGFGQEWSIRSINVPFCHGVVCVFGVDGFQKDNNIPMASTTGFFCADFVAVCGKQIRRFKRGNVVTLVVRIASGQFSKIPWLEDSVAKMRGVSCWMLHLK